MSAIRNLLATTVATSEAPAETPDSAANVYLYAGQLFVSPSPARITTILGSCLSRGLWDPVTGVGGMNHYMLPHNIGMNAGTPRFAPTAIRELLTQLDAAGAKRSRLQAKLFGGACVMASFQANGSDLGSRNVEVARDYLHAARIPVVFEDVGGTHGRKVVFRTDSGVTMVRKV